MISTEQDLLLGYSIVTSEYSAMIHHHSRLPRSGKLTGPVQAFPFTDLAHSFLPDPDEVLHLAPQVPRLRAAISSVISFPSSE